MPEISIEYLGELRTQITHGLSGVKLITDAPPDNQGKGESFSPTDLAAAALGSCIMTIVGIAAKTHGISMEGSKSKVEKIMASDPRRIGELVVDITFPSALNQKERTILERAAHSCPVGRSLSNELKETIQFHYS